MKKVRQVCRAGRGKVDRAYNCLNGMSNGNQKTILTGALEGFTGALDPGFDDLNSS